MTDELVKFIEYCNNIKSSSVIIVEGKRDIKTLKDLGIKCKIIAKGGMDINTFVDRILQYKHIIILSDFDKEGIRLQKTLRSEITHKKGHGFIDDHARHMLYKFAKANSSLEIEDLYRFIFQLNSKKLSRKVK
ncbi:MAG: toprim domain-containing protein [Candidatus Hodarchaeales archaeon]